MEVKAARNISVFNRIGGKSVRNEVCSYWLAGRCNRNPCRFLHRLPPLQGNHPKHCGNMTWRNPKHFVTKSGDEGRRGKSMKNISYDELVYDGRKGEEMDISTSTRSDVSATAEKTEIDKVKVQETHRSDDSATAERTEIDKVKVQETHPKQCKSLCHGSGFTMLATLEGHSEAISGISLPSGHEKLYSGGKDGCIRVWDCHSGQCAAVVNVNGEVGSLITVGPWLFVGLHNAVKAWNLESAAEFTLNGSGGLVRSLVTNDDTLFAGTEDGSILVWKWQPGANIPEPAALLKEHDGVVCSLIIGGEVLYSGSGDHTIKVWDVRNFKCLLTLRGHTRDVTGIFGFERCLVSASLDNTLKIWGETGNGAAEVIYEIKSDHGINAICGLHVTDAKPILLCSYDDNTVCLYDFPSFEERGRMYSKSRVTTIQMGADGLIFMGDADGEISVCKLLDSPCSKTS